MLSIQDCELCVKLQAIILCIAELAAFFRACVKIALLSMTTTSNCGLSTSKVSMVLTLRECYVDLTFNKEKTKKKKSEPTFCLSVSSDDIILHHMSWISGPPDSGDIIPNTLIFSQASLKSQIFIQDSVQLKRVRRRSIKTVKNITIDTSGLQSVNQ